MLINVDIPTPTRHLIYSNKKVMYKHKKGFMQ